MHNGASLFFPRNKGAADCWTVIATEGVDRALLREESLTTRRWFDLDDVLERRNEGWQQLQEQVRVAMGILSLSDSRRICAGISSGPK